MVKKKKLRALNQQRNQANRIGTVLEEELKDGLNSLFRNRKKESFRRTWFHLAINSLGVEGSRASYPFRIKISATLCGSIKVKEIEDRYKARMANPDWFAYSNPRGLIYVDREVTWDYGISIRPGSEQRAANQVINEYLHYLKQRHLIFQEGEV